MYNQLADSLLATEQPAAYNQAIMDFGATICKPKIPLCNDCPFQSICTAFKDQIVDKLPIKSKRLLKKNRYFHYIIFRQKHTIFCKKRIEKDIWQNLYEFYLLEAEKILSIDEILQISDVKKILSDISHTITTVSVISKQQLTHQLISGIFIEIKLEESIALTDDFIAVEEKNLFHLPMPKFILSYLSTKKV
jgi:A/G-specific adenine glycosylase